MKYISFVLNEINQISHNLVGCEEFQKKDIKVIQMPIIDICNSHCKMCNIWKNKDDKHISVSDYEQILHDSLFKNVTGVGINGGEPTLRPDLLEIVKMLARNLTKLKSINIITNGIESEKAFDVIKDVNNYLIKNDIFFNVCVSLDGDEFHHDRNRGVKGNYKSSANLIKKLQNESIDVWVGCTLTKTNVYAGDDILLFAEKNGLRYFEVRMGVDIKRLYNEGFYKNQKLSKDEKFHLTQFFQKMAIKFPDNVFYYSLFRQLAYNDKRIAGCSWRNSGITLDASGNLSFCSVASPLIGNCLSEKPSKIYQNNSKRREEIIEKYCTHCMHDLTGPVNLKTELSLINKRIKYLLHEHELKSVSNANIFEKIYNIKRIKTLEESRSVIITGWWGTETHGDKAILGELIDFINRKCPNLENFYLTCFQDMEYVVEKTIEELRETQVCDCSKYAGTIPIANFHKTEIFKKSDFIIIGGGPLERIKELYYIERAFRNGIKDGKGTFVFGCGIDPVLTGFEPLVRSILMHTQYAFFRDEESLERARELTQNNFNASYACDPALNFVRKWKDVNKPAFGELKFELCTLLRENTSEYLINLSNENIIEQNKRSIRKIASFISGVKEKRAFLSMNNLWIGGDDRLYNRKILNEIEDKSCIEYFEHKYMGLHELLMNISCSQMCLVTRYHGHLFSFALNIPFISIDYTGKQNKVSNLLRYIEYENLSVKWNELNAEELTEKYKYLDRNHLTIKSKLEKHMSMLTSKLEEVYEKFI